jgi:hypothetical protein
MAKIFVFLLVLFLIAFFGLYFMNQVMGPVDLQIMGVTVMQLDYNILSVVMALGIAASQIAIISFALIDRMFDTIRDVVRISVRLGSLVAFGGTAYQTFWPLIQSFLPQEIVGAQGGNPAAAIAIAQSQEFVTGLLLTLGLMLVYLVANRGLRSDSAQVRALQAELARRRASR